MKNAKGILVANGQYYLSKKIGAGSFGDIYIGKAVDDESVYVGVKLESSKSTFPQLEIEYQLYNSLSGGTGIPKAIYFGTEGDWNVLVIELLVSSNSAAFFVAVDMQTMSRRNAYRRNCYLHSTYVPG